MGNIVLLDDYTINKIAAGEVVDRPSSIVKELIENSIDANATQISVEIKNGGIKYIKISDNGDGIRRDDVEIAFERHATSKIRKESDIEKITSMGFRGEALASVAGISKVTLITRHKDEPMGTKYIIEGGNAILLEDSASNIGTTIIVENIFYNVPARYKFLKKDYTEAGYIEEVVTRLALSNVGIGFKYINNGKNIIQVSQNATINEVIYSIFGKDISQNIIEVNGNYEDLKVEGVIGNPKLARSTRQLEFTYINRRFVKDKMMNKAIEDSFEQFLGIGKFPFAVIDLKINPSLVDVNVHPAKLEVKFQDESLVYKAIYYSVKDAILRYENEISPFKNKVSQEIRKDEYSSAVIPKPIYENTSNDFNSYLQKNESLTKDNTSSFKMVVPNQSENMKIRETNNYIYDENYNQSEMKPYVGSQEEITSDPIEISYKYIGSIFNTYIIIEIKDRMYIIDQHAAHERLLYEKIKSNYYSKERETQMLLIPTLVELKNAEKEMVIKNIDMFEKAGFIIEEFGDNGIKICGIPNVGFDIDYKDMFIDSLDELMGASKTSKEEVEKRFLATLACKAAIKGNMAVKPEEHVSLINEMMKLDRPFTCPHGRPTAYEISKYEIERKFLRK